MDNEIFLPTLPHWSFGNNWSGSAGKLRFFITNTQAEEAGGEAHRQLLAELWDRDVCRELADILESRTFPCTEEGLADLRGWLAQRAQALNG